VRFEKKFLYKENCASLPRRWRWSCKFKSRRIGSWGRCYDHKFLRISPIFGEKMAFFSKTNVMIKILHNLALFWVKNANFFRWIFRRKYLKNHNISPWIVFFPGSWILVFCRLHLPDVRLLGGTSGGTSGVVIGLVLTLRAVDPILKNMIFPIFHIFLRFSYKYVYNVLQICEKWIPCTNFLQIHI
jgi:hypothetical protein